MEEYSSYTEAFHACKDELVDGLNYHEKLFSLQEADTEVRELIQDRQAEMKEEEELNSSPPAGGKAIKLKSLSEIVNRFFSNVEFLKSAMYHPRRQFVVSLHVSTKASWDSY